MSAQPTIERTATGLIIRTPFSADFNNALVELPRGTRRWNENAHGWIVDAKHLDWCVVLARKFFGGCVLLGADGAPDEVIDAHGGRSVQERLAL